MNSKNKIFVCFWYPFINRLQTAWTVTNYKTVLPRGEDGGRQHAASVHRVSSVVLETRLEKVRYYLHRHAYNHFGNIFTKFRQESSAIGLRIFPPSRGQ